MTGSWEYTDSRKKITWTGRISIYNETNTFVWFVRVLTGFLSPSQTDGGKRVESIRVVLLRVSGGLIEIPKLVRCHKLVRPRHFDQALSEIMRSLLHKFQQNSSTSVLFYIASFLTKDTKCNLQAPLKVIITDMASVFFFLKILQKMLKNNKY